MVKKTKGSGVVGVFIQMRSSVDLVGQLGRATKFSDRLEHRYIPDGILRISLVIDCNGLYEIELA